MYRNLTDFIADWQMLNARTVEIFERITDDVKQVKVHENVRTLERLAWHITHTVSEMSASAGIFETDELEHHPIPATMAEITAIYKAYSQKLVDTLPQRWTDDQLNDEVMMYGQTWTKGIVLSVIIAHEAHHRSQMTVIMRMVGLPVPGLYGPSKEEWEQMGMPALD